MHLACFRRMISCVFVVLTTHKQFVTFLKQETHSVVKFKLRAVLYPFGFILCTFYYCIVNWSSTWYTMWITSICCTRYSWYSIYICMIYCVFNFLHYFTLIKYNARIQPSIDWLQALLILLTSMLIFISIVELIKGGPYIGPEVCAVLYGAKC